MNGDRIVGQEPLFGIADELLSVEQAGDLLGTGPRFARRLIAERRIRFVRVGRFVRIPRSALMELIAAGTVQPMTKWRRVS